MNKAEEQRLAKEAKEKKEREEREAAKKAEEEAEEAALGAIATEAVFVDTLPLPPVKGGKKVCADVKYRHEVYKSVLSSLTSYADESKIIKDFNCIRFYYICVKG